MFEVDNYCLNTESIVTQPGTEIVPVTVTKETSMYLIIVFNKSIYIYIYNHPKVIIIHKPQKIEA